MGRQGQTQSPMRPLGSPEEIVVPSQDSTRALMKLKAIHSLPPSSMGA